MWFICAQRNYYRCFPVVLFFPRCFLFLCFRQFAICSLFFRWLFIWYYSMHIYVRWCHTTVTATIFTHIRPHSVHLYCCYVFFLSLDCCWFFFPIALTVWQFSFVNAAVFFFSIERKNLFKKQNLVQRKIVCWISKNRNQLCRIMCRIKNNNKHFMLAAMWIEIVVDLAVVQYCLLIWSDLIHSFACFVYLLHLFLGCVCNFYFVVLFCASLFITNYVWLIVTKSTIRSHDLAQYRFMHTL